MVASKDRLAVGAELNLPAVGPGGEPIDLRRTFLSHGLVGLAPMELHGSGDALTVTVPVPGSRARTVTLAPGKRRCVTVSVHGRRPGRAATTGISSVVSHILRLDEDLSGFYERIASDPDLAWAAAGAGRMVRSPSVFEDVIKTLCTTNCSWGATTRMVEGLVAHLGEPAAGAPAGSWRGRAFPTADAMAAADIGFYRDVIRAGYRAPHLLAIASSVASGDLELEELRSAELSDDEVERRLLALAGIGPYAAAHVMLLIGRYSRLILDSWTRPKYARLCAKRSVSDASIKRRFRRYGPYAGLAFWLLVTSDWVERAP